jgi:hypothetical protein
MRSQNALSALVILGVCAACGGGNNSGNTPGTDPGTTPPAPTYTIGGTVTGLRGSGLTLQNGNTHLPVASDGAFTFPDEFTSGTSYSVSVQAQPSSPTQACTVTDGGGAVGATNITNVAVTCVTPEASRSWQTAILLHQDDARAEEGPSLAINAHGSVALAWRQRDTNDVVQIWASRYTPEQKTWSAPTRLGPQGGGIALSAEAIPQVAISESGDTLAVWPQLVNGVYEVQESRYTDSAGWTAPVRIDTATSTAAYSRVIYDSSGNALVLWQQLDGTSYHIYYSWLTAAATTWSAPVRLDTTLGNAGSSRLAADAHGNVVALWTQTDSAQTDAIYHVWSSVYISSTAVWSPPAVVGNDPTLHAIFPSVACNADGTAEALWVLFDGSIWSNQYAPVAGWGAAKMVEAGGNGNQAPQMAIDPSGNVVAIWERMDPNTPTSHIRYAALPAGGGSWSASAQVSAMDAGASENTEVPQIAFDARGEALAIWSRFVDGHENARSAVYTPGTGWSIPVDAGNTADIDEPALAVAPNGTAVAAWQQISNGVSNLWANFFD